MAEAAQPAGRVVYPDVDAEGDALVLGRPLAQARGRAVQESAIEARKEGMSQMGIAALHGHARYITRRCRAATPNVQLVLTN